MSLSKRFLENVCCAANVPEDPLYILAGELTENPVIVDGAVNETRLTEVLQRLFDGGARKSKDWVAAWQAMFIPVERQAEVQPCSK